jgi:hypothetical protein
MKPKPFLKKLPNPPSEATLDEEMVCRFYCLLAKRAKTIIRPSPLLQAVDHPKPILKGKPSVVFELWRGPSFPHDIVHFRMDETEELKLVDAAVYCPSFVSFQTMVSSKSCCKCTLLVSCESSTNWLMRSQSNTMPQLIHSSLRRA